MPTVTVQGKILTCEDGANLRKVLLTHDINLHNGTTSVILGAAFFTSTFTVDAFDSCPSLS